MPKRGVLALGILCLCLALTSCQASTPKTRKALPEWSRGELLGISSLNQRVSMYARNNSIHLVWVSAEGKGLHYARLDATGRIQINTDITVNGAHPSSPQIQISKDGSIRILWTDNPRIPRTLFLARLSSDGQLLGEPKAVSPEGVRVSDYDLTLNEDDSLDVFWATEVPTEGGLYHLRLSQDDQIISPSRLLASNGAKPALQKALNGMIHIVWIEGPSLQENNVYYAVFDPDTQSLTTKARVGFFRTGTGLISYGPVMGLDATTAYVFWALEARGGNNAGEAQTYTVSFPLGAPLFSEASTLDIPGAARVEYTKKSGSLPYKQLASEDSGAPTPYLYMPSTLGGQNDQLGVWLVGQLSTRSRSSMRVLWAILSDGKLEGYQVPVQIQNAMRPIGTLDEQGNAHLVWLNTAGFGQYEVYYASTSEKVKAYLDRVTLQDWANDFLDAVWNLTPALGFFPPVFLLWSLASFLWVVIFYMVKVEGGMERRTSQVALAIAILLYLASKLFLMPGILIDYAPFIDRVPANLQFIPVLGTLASTSLAALFAEIIYFRKRPYRSLLVTYLLFVLTDALASLLIYVPNWIGA